MAIEDFLKADTVKECSTWPQVTTMGVKQLERLVFRAHTLAQDFGPFPASAGLDNAATEATINGKTYTKRALFLKDMQEAHILIVESLVFGAAALPGQAAGITSEKIGNYQASRSQGASAGEPVEAVQVPDEAQAILKRWRTADDPVSDVVRTSVFEETRYRDASDSDHKLVTQEGLFQEDMAPAARLPRWPQG